MMKIIMAMICLVAVNLAKSDVVFKNQFEALVASRVNQLTIKDPHFYTDIGGFCFDATSTINDEINTSISTDDNSDNNLDLNLLTRFDTDQFSDITGRSVAVKLIDGSCPDPLFSAACQSNGFLLEDLTSTVSATQNCLAPEPLTTSGYSPAIIEPKVHVMQLSLKT